ncbi:type II toxin-antitoxin system RelE/ParE family toxin [Variovorax sp. RHLX14]|uniref:type II toxin-antitoxin system RelE/ParE family toxin n=1 Tax=Variovorax sp. RHLX14 TaxID=1259731 RepID=UPI003F47C9E4
MTSSLHLQVEQDIEIAFVYYRTNAGAKVASRFLDEFERVAALLDANPGFGTPTSEERRSFPLRVYPYSIIYKPVGDGIRILVLRHQRLAPAFGSQRN